MNVDDPKFTAYALGELDDLTPAERAEIEALLTSDPTAAAEAAETKTLAARLRAELPGESAAPLEDQQRAAVLRALAEPAPAEKKVVRFPRRTIVLSVLAACAVVAISAGLIFRGLRPEEKRPYGTVSSAASPLISTATPPPDSAPSTWASPSVPLSPLPQSPDFASIESPNPTAHMVATASTVSRQSIDKLEKPSFAMAAPAQSADPSLDAAIQSAQSLGERLAETKERFAALQPSKDLEELTTKLPPPAIAPSPAIPVQQKPLLPQSVSSPAEPAPHPTSRTRAAKALETDDASTVGARGMVLRNQQMNEPQIRMVESERKASESVDISRRPQPGKAGAFRREVPSEDPSGFNTNAFDAIAENGFLTVKENPLSTFSIDVDTASYAIVRRFLTGNQLPPKGAVRIEELLNYFPYDYPQPQADVPFSATMEVGACPWAADHRLVRIGLKGQEIPKDQRPPSNLVFLIDVSGSMFMPNKLPLVKKSLGLLIDQLGPKDQVAIVVYAGNTGCVLEPTHDREAMREAIRRLEAGGSTNGASGIQLAYQLAEQSYIKGGTNRVILATDGDWNVGITNHSALLEMIAQKAKSGVFLTVLGFGLDNLKDSMLVKLADRGNGHYAYIDTLLEAKKVFVEELSSTLVTIAKDVKIQVEFNPAQVGAYRLVGYEKRLMAKEDFNDDKKDAGEIGAAHTVTALYEIVPAGKEQPSVSSVDKLKYQPAAPGEAPASPIKATVEQSDEAAKTAAPAAKALPALVTDEMLTLKLRYKAPDGEVSKLLEFPLTDPGTAWEKCSPDFHFAAAVAGYGMLLRDSVHRGQTNWSSVEEWARQGLGEDHSGYRAEFLSLLERAKSLSR